IGRGAGEERIVRRRDPVGELLVSVADRVFLAARSGQWLRIADQICSRVAYLPVLVREDGDFIPHLSARVARAGEISRESVEIVHGPSVEGMVMATAAVQPHAKEDLAGGSRKLRRVRGHAIVVYRAAVVAAALTIHGLLRAIVRIPAALYFFAGAR